MQQAVQTRTPTQLWIVGVLATLWNCWGAYDYIMTRTRNMDYLSSMPGVDANEMLAYVEAFPIYAQIGWGLGVWMGLLGSILLLFRSRWAVWAFSLSLVGMALSFGYMYLGGAQMPAGSDEGIMAYFPLVIIVIGTALFFYARAMEKKGVLR